MFGSNLNTFKEKFSHYIFEKIANGSVVKEDHPSAEAPVSAGQDNSDIGAAGADATLPELKDAITEAILENHSDKVLELVKKSLAKSPEYAATVAQVAKSVLHTLALEQHVDEETVTKISEALNQILGV